MKDQAMTSQKISLEPDTITASNFAENIYILHKNLTDPCEIDFSIAKILNINIRKQHPDQELSDTMKNAKLFQQGYVANLINPDPEMAAFIKNTARKIAYFSDIKMKEKSFLMIRDSIEQFGSVIFMVMIKAYLTSDQQIFSERRVRIWKESVHDLVIEVSPDQMSSEPITVTKHLDYGGIIDNHIYIAPQPETVVATLAGKKLDDVLVHPLLSNRGHIIRKAENVGQNTRGQNPTKTHIVLETEPPKPLVELIDTYV